MTKIDSNLHNTFYIEKKISLKLSNTGRCWCLSSAAVRRPILEDVPLVEWIEAEEDDPGAQLPRPTDLEAVPLQPPSSLTPLL